MIGNRFGHRFDPYLYLIFKTLFGEKGNPNLFTLLGFFVTLLASFLVLRGFWFWAGLAIVVSGLFDLMDGVIARRLKKVTLFGAFFDSVMDRYSDLLFLMALLIRYLIEGLLGMAILAAAVSVGTALIPYIRARAEAIQIPCDVGLMERAERIILLSLGLLLNWMGPILWIMAILTHLTALQRIHHVWKRLHINQER